MRTTFYERDCLSQPPTLCCRRTWNGDKNHLWQWTPSTPQTRDKSNSLFVTFTTVLCGRRRTENWSEDGPTCLYLLPEGSSFTDDVCNVDPDPLPPQFLRRMDSRTAAAEGI